MRKTEKTKKKIWIVLAGYDYEGCALYSVHSSKQKAIDVVENWLQAIADSNLSSDG